MGFIHSKTRNRLNQERSDMLQFIYINLRAIRTAEHGKHKRSRKRKRIEETGIITGAVGEAGQEVEDEEDATALEILAAEAVRAAGTAASDAIWGRLQAS